MPQASLRITLATRDREKTRNERQRYKTPSRQAMAYGSSIHDSIEAVTAYNTGDDPGKSSTTYNVGDCCCL